MSNEGLQILLVEDNPRDAFVFREALAADPGVFTYELVHATTLAEALRQLALNHPDIIVLDLTLPDSRGWETFEKARALANRAPLLLMTALDDEELAIRALREGAQDYLVKSQITGPLLVRAIRYAMERHRTRLELAESAEKLRRLNKKHQALLHTTPNGLCLINEHWVITFANPAMMRLLSTSSDGTTEDLTGIDFEGLFQNPAVFSDYQAAAQQAIGATGEYKTELPLKTSTGELTWCEVVLARIDTGRGGGAGYVATITDVSQRRAAEVERLRLAAAVEQSTEAVLITDTDLNVLYANRAFETMSGTARQAILGRKPELVLGSGNYNDLFRDTITGAIQCHGSWSGQFTSYRPDGTSYDEQVTVRPICDETGGFMNYVLTRRDVSRETKLEDELRQSQKLEAVGLLAGGIAHDFNNILQVVIGISDMLLQRGEVAEPIQEDLKRILNAGHRGAGLTRQLLAYSRKQPMQPQLLDVNAVVTELVSMLKRLIGEDIHLHVEQDTELSPIMADPAQLEQVVLNLALNARDAMPEGGRLIVTTANVDLNERFAREHIGVEPGPYVRISVEDTGVGMDEATRLRIFDPFFTTKELGKGTGLGLATVYGIIRQSGGHIYVTSAVGRGTTFDVYLPQTESLGGLVAEPHVSTQNTERAGTILLVEDEPDVRELIRMLLLQAGFTVVSASNGTEALLVEDQLDTEVDLLITDVVMPEMNGSDLAQQLRQRRPQMRVVFISGYAQSIAQNKSLLPPGSVLLQKPFSAHALLERIDDAMAANREGRRTEAVV